MEVRDGARWRLGDMGWFRGRIGVDIVMDIGVWVRGWVSDEEMDKQ